MGACWDAAVPMTSLGLRCGLSAPRLELIPLHQQLYLVGRVQLESLLSFLGPVPILLVSQYAG